MTVTLDKFGRVLIPKPVRDHLGLRPGAELALDVRDGGDGAPTLELRPEREQPCFARVNGLLVFTGELADPDYDVVAHLRQQREERARHHAGPAWHQP